ncbi:MAG: polyphosphate kinase 1 [Treponema sp.]|jgi:polyphosphate kinase|nr:polyphosphate kinase 1 [Treponema sp.]
MEDGVYLNRELSWIDFNTRVLEEGLRQNLPPLERFRYLSIVSSNFDEFFMIRVAAIKRLLRDRNWGQQSPSDASGLGPEKLLKEISSRVRSVLSRQYDCLLQEIFPALAQGGLELLRPEGYSPAHRDYLESLFMREIYPVLTPLRIEDGGSLPSIESIRLYAAFLLAPESVAVPGANQGTKPVSGGELPAGISSPGGASPEDHISIIQIPPALNRIIWLPPGTDKSGDREKNCWALLDDVVMIWGNSLYPGYTVREGMLFQVNRDADFSVDEKRDEDFIEAMEEVLVNREKSMAVRMVYSPGSGLLRDELARRLELNEEDLYEIRGPLSLGSLRDLITVPGFDSLKEPPWKIYAHPGLLEEENLWERISQEDVMIHLPYQSFDPVIRFFREAAADPAVVAIKTALYRTSGDSPIIRALEQAALNGKQVTAVVELKARFDEEQNISWANRLEKAGVIVVYGLARLKVHAKVSLVMRRENGRIKRYVHLSTGNYNDRTAKLYEDIGIFTTQDEIAYDAGLLFNMITGYSVIHSMRRLVIAPTALKRRLLEYIDRETKRSRPESPGRIMAKMNALVDTDIINALYRASRTGVKVLLNVRGICLLIPGLRDFSENIQVVSVIDHYLEHSRIFYFANGGAEELYLSSADWMPRNLERRVELMFPVLRKDLKAQIYNILRAYFQDNCHAWLLGNDGRWTMPGPPPGEKPFRIQEYLLNLAAETLGNPWAVREEFIVRRGPQGET